MATARRKPAPRRRNSRATAKKSGGHSLTYLVFGVVIGLALAAFLTYYLKSSPMPFGPQTTQSSPATGTPSRTQQQPPLTAPSRTPEVQAPVVVTQSPTVQPSTPIAAQQPAQQPATPVTRPSAAPADPLTPILDPNTGLVTVPAASTTSKIDPNALIKTKPEAAKNQASNNAQVAKSTSAGATTSPSTAPSKPKANPAKSTAPDQIGQLIQAIPDEKKAPSVSNTLAKAPLRIEAPAATTATDKGTLLSPNTSSSASKPATSPASATGTARYLQVGSFANFDEADATRARMLLLGFSNVSISKTKVNNREFNRVRIGPFSDEQALKSSQQKLQSANIKATVVR